MSALGWAGQVVDAAVLALLVILLRRLGRDPVAAWRARESALRAIFDDLRNLVAQAEGLARDLDAKLVARAAELRRLAAPTGRSGDALHTDDAPAADIGEPMAAVDEPTLLSDEVPPRPGDEALALDIAARVRTLAQVAVPVEEIARRLDVPAAEVRLLIAIDEDEARADPDSMSFAFASGRSTSQAT